MGAGVPPFLLFVLRRHPSYPYFALPNQPHQFLDTQETEETLLDYEDTEEQEGGAAGGGAAGGAGGEAKKDQYVGLHGSGFRDFMLKAEIMRAIVDCAFEHPSTGARLPSPHPFFRPFSFFTPPPSPSPTPAPAVQTEAIPAALIGGDVLVTAKSGMGKTAVFVLSTLNQFSEKQIAAGEVAVIVLAHVRELAFQIGTEYDRFSKYLPGLKTAVFIGGQPEAGNEKTLREVKPQVVIGTPGRIMSLIEKGSLKTDKVKHFILDECDKMLEAADMRSTVQKIFLKTPHNKQVMMFSATMAPDVHKVCLKFMKEPLEVQVGDGPTKMITLHGLQQYFVKLKPEEKNRKTSDLLDALEFNQVVIFVNKPNRAEELDRLLNECTFPSLCMHGKLQQEERFKRYQAFKSFQKRVLVCTNLLGRGIDIERVNVVINYDFPSEEDPSGEPAADQYLHRVGRAGRFGTKGLAISFISSEADEKALQTVQVRFEVAIPELPEVVPPESYQNNV